MLNLCVENYEWKILKTLDGGWMGGWMDGRMEAKAGLRIAYSNQKFMILITLKLNFNEGQFYKKT